ncbi:hypothetical protein FRB96_006731 [Tulasnella sp. 330]|nr:hypothetical protein FRB96_006731 [Tulasnella sp. 330]KAG8881863.1 hypothetical protein FRB97_008987 [Tulasnella sp. 331]KAG8882411.1 hypothetical protein FRB98_003717 [Tulasnella sp. 332]
MARLLYHDVVIHGVVCSVPLNAIQDHMYTFPSRDDPIYNAPLTRHATMDIETSTWATLITMRMLRSIAALPLNHRVTPSARVPPEFSAHDDLLASTLSSWDQGHGQTFVGYYTYSVPHPFHDGQEDEGNGGQVDPPTTFTLRYDHGTGALNGKGHDLAGGFTVVGHATRDGFVSFHKKYAGHRWFWRGVILKWGIAGLWGGAIRRGMFYMWPADKTKAAINMATG